jgi:hypothetical protein
LTAWLAEPARDIGRHQPAGRNLRADELERRLSAVRMSGQAEIDTQLGGAVESIGIVAEKNIDAISIDEALDVAEKVRDRSRRPEPARL